MKLLQTVKAFFADTFPLHLNKTVKALEETHEGQAFALSCLRSTIKTMVAEMDDLIEANNEYRKQNTRAVWELAHQDMHIRHLQKQLDDLYESMAPKLSQWPLKADARLERGGIFDEWAVRIRVPELDFRMVLSKALRTGNHPEFIEHVAREVAEAYKQQTYKLVTQFLNENLKSI